MITAAILAALLPLGGVVPGLDGSTPGAGEKRRLASVPQDAKLKKIYLSPDARRLGFIASRGNKEFAVVDGHGLVYFNIEDTAELATLDARAGKLVARYSIAPCSSPTGLDMDPQGRLYSVCDNGLMVVSDPVAGKVVGQAGIGAGPDGVVWLDGYAISANGRDGTATIVAESAPGHFEALATITVAPGARTIAADRALHKLYLPTAEFEPEAPAAPGQKPARPRAIAGTFQVIVVSAP